MGGADLLTPLSADMNSLSLDSTHSGSSTVTVRTHLIYLSLLSNVYITYLSLSLSQTISPVVVNEDSMELLNRISGNGLGVKYRFLRKPHLSSDRMISVELTFTNTGSTPISEVTIGGSGQLQAGMKMAANVKLSQLAPGGSMSSTIGIDFNDTLQPAKFSIW